MEGYKGEVLVSYLVNNYEKGEPIFLMDIVIKGMTEENIRYHLKKMTDKTDYTKKPLSITEQIARLKQRGLVFVH